MRSKADWAAAGMGAAAGLLVMLAASYLGNALLWLADRAGLGGGGAGAAAVLALSLLAGELTAGYTGGRLGKAAPPGRAGSMAALGLYGVVAALSLAGGSPAGPWTLLLFGGLAAAVGYGGGVLGGRPRRR